MSEFYICESCGHKSEDQQRLEKAIADSEKSRNAYLKRKAESDKKRLAAGERIGDCCDCRKNNTPCDISCIY